ncbi:hypothetical protein OIU84_004701 [Salix udensis]|uniref:Isochorismatase-like domain-containing protein n=1 Tax=Salix udensis TaxID=889485 RepID=A0AAD6K2Y6_9ROSI|nr:hypothetical protein OIU84_004701 [Salix udensis]
MADKWSQTALLVIDMQNDFILEDGLMKVNGGKAIVPNVIKAVDIARQRGIPCCLGCPAFFATHLHSFLRTEGIKSLVITGVQTPNCIRQTVFDAVALDYQPVTVIVDATAAATPDIHAGSTKGRNKGKRETL